MMMIVIALTSQMLAAIYLFIAMEWIFE